MEQEEARVTLSSIGSGAASELFEHAIRRVLDNIADVNTDPKSKREINLKFLFVPNDERSMIATAINCETKVAPPKGLDTVLFSGVKKDGGRYATEYNPTQTRLFDMPVKGGQEQ